MSSQVYKQNPHKGPRQRFLNKKKFDPDRYIDRKIVKEDCIPNCCEKCIKCIIWKIDYGKFKPLHSFAKCHKCNERNIPLPYHKVCRTCAETQGICAKCESPYECEVSDTPDETLNFSEILGEIRSMSTCSTNRGSPPMSRAHTPLQNVDEYSQLESDEDEVL